MRADIVVGARFPDYELTDHTRTRRHLSELQGRDPLILVLARGHFCPKDHQQHLENEEQLQLLQARSGTDKARWLHLFKNRAGALFLNR